ncbi:flavin reductase family protein [Flavobacterium sp. D11R37]|uniref:flavin reductase family protein n=1 Tax=Flavobacterium coralii TaxID=2838017 RepID=UPI001CA63A1D|nr:flavin reductase family protein [Flavobacterium coralii]MBY8962009.1 flavin reductase family protein [Flavobacterium coralii]
MQIDPLHTSQKDIYKILTGTVIPRPIGWVSTTDAEGNYNLAPFSFFNAVGEDPPHVMFSTVRTGNVNKDTLNNVLQTGEFVVNMATEDLVEKMNTTSANLKPDESEFELAGLTPAPSLFVKAPRVLESPVNMECKLVHNYSLEDHKNGGATIMIGRVVMFHVDDSILLDNYKINQDAYRPVARLAGWNYSKLGEIFSIKRPE